MAPRIIKSVYTEFFSELRKVAKAIIKHPTLECKLAALIVIRKHILPNNALSKYPVSCHNKKEMEILNR